MLETEDLPDSVSDAQSPSVTNSRLAKITEARKRTKEGQLRQAERMLKRSRTCLMSADKGDNVMIPIPLVDRGKGDPRNLIGVIIDRNTSDDLYKIAARNGLLKGRFSRNQFDVSKERFLTEDSVDLTKAISVRQAVIAESLGGGQGFVKCNCSMSGKRCATNRCKCHKNKVLCNSRCHGSLICKNKQ
ncbi:hypothetical protein V1264_008149 [Littorina saxatilis]|uniref:Uncharacterized protein n=1 Tax=Littorina saxatilis TaxID=31220 RepID=A0AAN9G217_9CAEN